jgi:hypothetical protein
MTLRDDLDRIAREAAWDIEGATGWVFEPKDRPAPDEDRIRRALAEFGEACAKMLDESSPRFSQPEGAALIRSALGREKKT